MGPGLKVEEAEAVPVPEALAVRVNDAVPEAVRLWVSVRPAGGVWEGVGLPVSDADGEKVQVDGVAWEAVWVVLLVPVPVMVPVHVTELPVTEGVLEVGVGVGLGIEAVGVPVSVAEADGDAGLRVGVARAVRVPGDAVAVPRVRVGAEAVAVAVGEAEAGEGVAARVPSREALAEAVGVAVREPLMAPLRVRVGVGVPEVPVREPVARERLGVGVALADWEGLRDRVTVCGTVPDTDREGVPDIVPRHVKSRVSVAVRLSVEQLQEGLGVQDGDPWLAVAVGGRVSASVAEGVQVGDTEPLALYVAVADRVKVGRGVCVGVGEQLGLGVWLRVNAAVQVAVAAGV